MRTGELANIDDGEVAQIVESAEINAYTDYYAAAPPEVAAEYGLKVERVEEASLLLGPKLHSVLFNRALGLGLAAPTSETAVDAVVEAYRAAGSPSFAVQVSPLARPPTLPSWLEARGLRVVGRWAKVIRGAEPPPRMTTDLRIEQVGHRLSALFGQVAVEAFGMPEGLGPWLVAIVGRPSWHAYVARDGDQVVATGALFVRGDVGWLGVGATLPSHRRRGAQGALMARRIEDAVKLGCRWLVTETGEDTPERPNPSFHNMVRAGFQLAYLRPSFEPVAE